MDQGGPGREEDTGAHCRELRLIRRDSGLSDRLSSGTARNIFSIDQGLRPDVVVAPSEAIRVSRSRSNRSRQQAEATGSGFNSGAE